ncbi:MAG TPA: diguanylate cyclase [Syntrophales bacterium]|nr:diguanylate cyclase [Syntrophales bacterium]HPQ44130.1 diguanylate cyclase [Syntrophales bacterium]
MKDTSKTNQELIAEISALQKRIKELEHSEVQRKQAEEALESEHTLLRTLIDNVPDRIYAKDSEGRFIICNEAMIRRMGMTSMAELEGKSDFDFLPWEMAQRFHADEQAIIQSGTPMINREEPLRTENGKITRWNLASKVPLLDRDGNRIGIVGVGREITDRKQAEEALRWSEIQLHAILESTADGILAVDDKGKMIKTNRRFIDLWRIPQSLMDAGDDRALMDFVTDQLSDPESFLNKVRLLHDSDMADEDTLAFKDGRVFERFSFPMIKEGVVIGRVWSFRDITERERMETALRDREEKYRELSIIDDLTKLYNSRHFYVQLKIELDRVNRYEQPLTLLMLDLDDFKKFNDTYGHVEGDQVLRRFGQVAKRCLRETDFAYRYGGEEFTILLPMTTSVDGAVIAERIRTEFKKEIFSPVPGQAIHVTVSIGLAQYKQQEDMKTFVHRADQFMYQGKKNGKDRVCSET